MKFVAQVAS